MIQIKHTKDLVTFSTILRIADKYISLSSSQLSTYFEQIKNPTFADMFLYPRESFMAPQKGSVPGLMYQTILESNYNLPGKWHELTWKEIKFENKGFYGIIADTTRSYQFAIPGNDTPRFTRPTIRYDYITDDGKYHYDCKQGIYPDAIEIIKEPSFFIYPYPFIPKDIKYFESKEGSKKDRVEETFEEFKEGETYFTKFATREKFTIHKIIKTIKGKIIRFEGIYEDCEHLELCPIEPSRLLKHKVEVVDYYIIKEQMMGGLNKGDVLLPIEGTEYCEHWSKETTYDKEKFDKHVPVTRFERIRFAYVDQERTYVSAAYTLEHSLCNDKVSIKCINDTNCKPVYK